MLPALIDDLLAENEALHAFVAGLPADSWDRVTPFFGWTMRDQILHLHQVDRFGLASLSGEAAFGEVFRAARAGQAEGIELSAQIRGEFAGVDDAAVLARWRTTFQDLVARFRAADPKVRMTWFGPPMSVTSFASARLMEVWAHGQDIYDMLGQARAATPRIRHVCDIGVRTFGWSFRNRGLDVPAAPAVGLTGPDGQAWDWAGEGNGRVSGPALDFALIVTQRRAPGDTAIAAEGEAAAAWLPIAQCFAGPPQEPAAPGSRPPL